MNDENQEAPGQGASILQGAIAEFESIMSKKEEGDAPAAPRRGANPARSKNVLGRGLSALMSISAVQVDPGQGDAAQPARPQHPVEDVPHVSSASYQQPAHTLPTAEPAEGALAYLPIDRIVRNENQPRQHFDEHEIETLRSSIAESGLLQPIIVRRKSAEAGPLATYEIVAGERRWRAAQRAGLARVPALVRQLNDRETLELSIVENVQRANLNPVEEALAFQRLITEFGATQEEVAKSVGKDRSSVANALRLLRLESEVLDLLREGRISAGHGRALLVLPDGEAQRVLADRIVREQLSVRAVEEIVSRDEPLTPPSDTPAAAVEGEAISPAIQELEERFRRALGTKVRLIAKNGKGELRIRFFSSSELESLLEKLGA